MKLDKKIKYSKNLSKNLTKKYLFKIKSRKGD